MIKTALVLKGERGILLFRLLRECSEIDLVGIACPDGKTGWLTEVEWKKYFVTTNLDKITALPEMDTVVDGTGESEVSEYLKENLGSGVRLEQLTSRSVLNALINSR